MSDQDWTSTARKRVMFRSTSDGYAITPYYCHPCASTHGMERLSILSSPIIDGVEGPGSMGMWYRLKSATATDGSIICGPNEIDALIYAGEHNQIERIITDATNSCRDTETCMLELFKELLKALSAETGTQTQVKNYKSL